MDHVTAGACTTRLIAPEVPGTGDAAAALVADDIRISPEDAWSRVTRGETLLLDVIGDAAWRSLKEVPSGALRLPPGEAAERIGELPREGSFAVFCT